ncbi:hypothetical protein ABIB57_005382 [Devosia sp. UYZn731]|uniref:hypothetical protein n=1 Tax=Devosia sp. UYZn731 TaxID=3156345 RepID=UPI0033997465
MFGRFGFEEEGGRAGQSADQIVGFGAIVRNRGETIGRNVAFQIERKLHNLAPEAVSAESTASAAMTLVAAKACISGSLGVTMSVWAKVASRLRSKPARALRSLRWS